MQVNNFISGLSGVLQVWLPQTNLSMDILGYPIPKLIYRDIPGLPPGRFSRWCKSMQTLDKHIVKAMLPDGDIISLDLNEPLDGDQILQFHYVSLLAAIKRFIADPAYADKLYTQFEYQFSMEFDLERMLGN